MDLLEAAEHYAALDEPEDAVWSAYSDRCRELISNLKILGSELVRPVILSGTKKLDPSEFEKLLWILEVIVVRWQIIGEGRTGTIERLCARLAQQIWTGAVKRRTDAIAVVRDLYIDDDAFRENFSIQEGLANKKTVYLLKRIEDAERGRQRGGAAKDLAPHHSLTLEHILPDNPSPDWNATIAADPKIVEECGARIGNLCLLNQPRNRDAGHSGFPQKKKKMYADSDLLTTQQVANYPVWDRQSIENRQLWLASRAVMIWKL